jgi:hypothetical protein
MTDWGGDNVVRVTTSGQLTGRFSIRGTGGKSPWGIAAGPDGNLWFTEHGSDRIARITPSGQITEFSAGVPPKAMPTEVTVGADGALWFAQAGSFWSDGPSLAIGRITMSGAVSQIPTRLLVEDVAAGADGKVYATGTRSYGERAIGALARISPAGGVTEIPIGPCSYPREIAAGPDGNVWFVDENISGACPPFHLGFWKRARVSRSGIARIGVQCDGGDITVPCRDVSFRMTAKVRSAARGNARGKRGSRHRTVTVGSARLSIGGGAAAADLWACAHSADQAHPSRSQAPRCISPTFPSSSGTHDIPRRKEAARRHAHWPQRKKASMRRTLKP